MRALFRKHTATIAVAFITAAVVAGPAGLFDGGGSSGSVAVAQSATNCPSPTVGNIPCIKYGFKDGPVDVPATLTTIASLPIGPGKYVINAKLYIQNGIYASEPLTAECQLVAGANFDWAKESIPTTYESSGGFTSQHDLNGTMALTVANRFASAGSIQLKCLSRDENFTDHDLRAHFIKITAEKMGTLLRVNM